MISNASQKGGFFVVLNKGGELLNMVEAVRSEGERRMDVYADLVEAEKPLFEIVIRQPNLNDGGQAMNMREDGRLLMALGLDGESQYRYLAFDTDEVTDIVVVEVLTDEVRDHHRALYRTTHLEADIGDSSILVFYNKEEKQV